MTRDEMIQMLFKSVAEWNQWRSDNPGEYPDLYGADLTRAYLRGAYLTRADLRGAYLTRADLTGADLRGADLRGADLTRANLTRANLTRADLTGADLTGADLTGANLYGANLTGANLTGADLTRANLTGADLTRANLTRADLYGADLYGANLTRAIGIDAFRCTPLMLLLDQPGSIRLYKLVNSAGEGPFNGGIRYEQGQTYEVAGADTEPQTQCGAGINVATLDWCMREWVPGYRILLVEFTAADIACIPLATDGKIRLHRCRVVGEKDLVELGLEKAPEPEGTA